MISKQDNGCLPFHLNIDFPRFRDILNLTFKDMQYLSVRNQGVISNLGFKATIKQLISNAHNIVR